MGDETTQVVTTQPVTTVTTTPTVPVTPGYQSSEFWLSVVSSILGILLTSGVIVTGSNWDKIAGIAVTILSSLGYTVSRTMVKKG